MDTKLNLPKPVTDTNGKPKVFPFPKHIKPYQCQEDLMGALWDTLEGGGIGVFESPTGTGKSMSLICGSLAWLQYHEEQLMQVDNNETANDETENDLSGAPDWVAEHVADQRQAKRRKTGDILKKKTEQIAKQREQLRANNIHKKRRVGRPHIDRSEKLESNEEEEVLSDDDFMPQGFGSEEEESFDTSESEAEPEEEDLGIPQILFCSRTHSQLAQFVDEIKNSPFGDTARVVPLGSRQSLCVNESVRSLGSISQINDKCKDLQEKKSSKNKDECGCPFMHQGRIGSMADVILAEVQDIEQLVPVGRRKRACSYYSTRKASTFAQVIVMPYNVLLHKATREAVGIKLKNNVVIIDEAHNLHETLENIHSSELTGSVLQRAHTQLNEYHARYKARLSPKNLVSVNSILSVLKSFLNFLSSKESGKEVTTVNDFMHKTKNDNVNFFEIQKYFERSEISKKVMGFAKKYMPEVNSGGEYVSKHVSSLRMAEEFLYSLQNPDKDGRIVVSIGSSIGKSSLKFLLLNSSIYFEEILEQCRAVVVAGGTMEPIDDFIDRIVSPKLIRPKVSIFSCGHVVPSHHLLPIVCKKSQSSRVFNFSYNNRMKPELVKDLGRSILNLCNVCPGGMIVFLPSYDYEKFVYNLWDKEGIVQKLEAKKKLFREPTESSEMDKILKDYAQQIQSVGGALLLSVVGGKLSEGINFKDDLGRCVVMVGLPYPNKESPELKEKMAFINKFSKQRDSSVKMNLGDAYYENLCMRAVNQSIGRAIRHKDDYASIVFFDERYSRDRIKKKVSKWLGDLIVSYDEFGPVIRDCARFFKSFREQKT
eukprot:m.156726 g.156726  ORF g.156726 m.156726 type:complete len:823 (-) comp15104_c0_seq2:1730-4198(-)